MLKKTPADIESLKTIDDKLRWLSAWTIHHANHIRESADGLKVGGHQASCASMTAIMAALYFHALGPNDLTRFSRAIRVRSSSASTPGLSLPPSPASGSHSSPALTPITSRWACA